MVYLLKLVDLSMAMLNYQMVYGQKSASANPEIVFSLKNVHRFNRLAHGHADPPWVGGAEASRSTT